VVATPSPPSAAPVRGSHATLPPVPLDATAAPLTGVSARLVSVRATTTKSELPGETSGAALEVVVEVENRTSRPVDLSAGVVNLYLGKDRTPAVPTDTASTPFASEVGPGGSARGSFVFRVHPDDGRRATVELDLGAASNVVLFQGARPQQGQ
jgi:hypothetical protein